jgi:hypothetical protein
MVPKQIRLTDRPERPKFLYFISQSYLSLPCLHHNEDMKLSQNGRTYSNVCLKRILALLNVKSVLNVSGWDDGDKEGGRYSDYFSQKVNKYEVSHFEDDYLRSDTDLSKIVINLEDVDYQAVKKFELVFSHTVLEHVFDQQNAFRIMCSLAEKYVVGVVPMINVLHWEKTYDDYWRFTPHGIRKLFENNEFKLVHLEIGPTLSISQYIIFVGARNGVSVTSDFSLQDISSGEAGLFRITDLLRIAMVRILEKF